MMRVGQRTRILGFALSAVIALAGCASQEDHHAHDNVHSTGTTQDGRFAATEFPEARPRPVFTLTDHSGQQFDFAARTQGTPTLLFFGYTHCPDICPMTMAEVATALREAPVQIRNQLQVVFVTTDPAQDTPKVLEDWLGFFDKDLPRKFIGLTGSQADIDAAQRAADIEIAMDNGQTHSTQLTLYTEDDLGHIFYTTGFTASELSNDLQLILGGGTEQ